jgi:hypothetical protein
MTGRADVEREQASISAFSPITEAELIRARHDPAFRHRLLQQSLDTLLGKLQKERQTTCSTAASEGQMREGVTLAVRLAELIQATTAPSREG